MDKSLEIIMDGIIEAGLEDIYAGVDKITEAFDETVKDYDERDRKQLLAGIKRDLKMLIEDRLETTR